MNAKRKETAASKQKTGFQDRGRKTLKVPRIKDEAYVLPTIWRYLSGPVCLLPWVHRSMEILPALLIPNSWDSLSERFCKQSSHILLRIVCSFHAKNRIYQGLTENSPSTALALRLFRVLNHVSLNIPPGAQVSSPVKIACWLSTQETQLEVVTPKNRSNPASCMTGTCYFRGYLSRGDPFPSSHSLRSALQTQAPRDPSFDHTGDFNGNRFSFSPLIPRLPHGLAVMGWWVRCSLPGSLHLQSWPLPLAFFFFSIIAIPLIVSVLEKLSPGGINFFVLRCIHIKNG